MRGTSPPRRRQMAGTHLAPSSFHTRSDLSCPAENSMSPAAASACTAPCGEGGAAERSLSAAGAVREQPARFARL